MNQKTAFLALATVLAIAPVSRVPGANEGSQSVDETRQTLARWVETQQIISKEKKDWQDAQEILKSRIALLEAEIASVDKRLGEARTASADVNRRHDLLTNDDAALRSAAAALAGWAGQMEASVRALHPRLPEPAVVRIAPLYNRMPADASSTKVSLAERFQNIAGIVNELNKVNGEISLTSEIRTLSDGKPLEVQVVYVGLGQGYFISPGGEAGVGRPGDNGWVWQNENDLAPGVRQVVETLQNKAKPRFVPLPVKVQ